MQAILGGFAVVLAATTATAQQLDKELYVPDKATWDSLSVQEQVLYLGAIVDISKFVSFNAGGVYDSECARKVIDGIGAVGLYEQVSELYSLEVAASSPPLVAVMAVLIEECARTPIR